MLTRRIINLAGVAGMMYSVVATPASAQLLATAGSLPASVSQAVTGGASAVTPGIAGNTVQVGAGKQRVGSTTGLTGPQGTPTTAVGVAVLTPDHPPQGSVASAEVSRSGGATATVQPLLGK